MSVEFIKKYNTEKFFADKPTSIGIVGEWHFFEHPTYGDECPLVAYNTRTKETGLSDWWELPRLEEIYYI